MQVKCQKNFNITATVSAEIAANGRAALRSCGGGGSPPFPLLRKTGDVRSPEGRRNFQITTKFRARKCLACAKPPVGGRLFFTVVFSLFFKRSYCQSTATANVLILW